MASEEESAGDERHVSEKRWMAKKIPRDLRVNRQGRRLLFERHYQYRRRRMRRTDRRKQEAPVSKQTNKSQ